MAEQHTEDPPKLEIDWLKTLAGALAAVTAAVCSRPWALRGP